MSVCLEQRQEFFDFFNARMGTVNRPGPSQVIASLRGDEIAAVVLYARMHRGACEMGIASDGRSDWASRAFFKAIFTYPFLVLGLNRCTAFVAESNVASLKLVTRLGFQMEGVARQYRDGEDAYLLGMLRSECKWIE